MQRTDPGLVDHGVGVEQQHVAAGGESVGQPVVDPRGEATVAARIQVAHSEVGAHLAHERVGRVVDDGDGEVADGLEARSQEVRSVVGHDDDLGVRRGGGRARATDALVQRHVVPTDRVPGERVCARQPLTSHCRPHRRVGAHVVQCTRQGGRITRWDEQTGTAHDVGERTAVAGDHRRTAGHRLDRHAAELLDPRRRREGGDREHVETAVELRQLGLVDRPDDVDATVEVLPRGPDAQRARLRTRPGDGEPQVGVRGDRLEEDVDALVRLKATDVPDPDQTLWVGSPFAGGGEELGVDAQPDGDGAPGQSLVRDDAAGLVVAHAHGARVTQGPPLRPTEGGWVALVDVLRGVQDEGGA